MRKKISIVSMVIVMLFATMAASSLATTAKDYAAIINISGRQRMLTQKMSKEMLLVAKAVDAEKNREELKKTAALFDKSLKGLINGSDELGLPPTVNKRILKVLNKVTKLWSGFRQVVDSAAAGGGIPVSGIADLNLPLLKTMNTAVRLYEKEAKKKTGRVSGIVINLAGKQRMLTQKMSKEMLLIALNHDPKKNIQELRKTASLFDRTLKGLRDGDKDFDLPGTTDNAIVAQLDKIKSLWNNFKPIIDKVTDIDAGDISIDDIKKMAGLNLPLLKEMNKAVKMYEKAETQ